MKRWKKPDKKVCTCNNCGFQVLISPDSVKEKTFGNTLKDAIIATYVECPVCGEKNLKQLDTESTRQLAEKGVKLDLLQKRGKKLSDKQKVKLKSIERQLSNDRKLINKAFWDKIYQLLNPEEEPKTGIADQELIPGSEVTNAGKLGERTVEHV